MLAWFSSSSCSPRRGSDIITCLKFSAYFSNVPKSSSYSAPCIKCVGCTISVLTLLFIALSRAWSTLSILTPSLAWTWLIMICEVNALLTENVGNAFCIAFSIPPISLVLLSLNDVPKLTTRISISPISSAFNGSSSEASPVSLPK